jgi:hypothetical protein
LLFCGFLISKEVVKAQEEGTDWSGGIYRNKRQMRREYTFILINGYWYADPGDRN